MDIRESCLRRLTMLVMILSRGRGRTRASAFSLGGQVLPRIKLTLIWRFACVGPATFIC